MYIPKNNLINTHLKETVLRLPYYDNNFIQFFAKSNVAFVILAYNIMYLYIDRGHGQNSYLADITVISKDNYYGKYSRNI